MFPYREYLSSFWFVCCFVWFFFWLTRITCLCGNFTCWEKHMQKTGAWPWAWKISSWSPEFYISAASVGESPPSLPGTVLSSIFLSSLWANLWAATGMAVLHCVWWAYSLSGLLDMWGLRGWVHSYWWHNTVSGCSPCCDRQAPHSATWQVVEWDRSHNALLIKSVCSPATGEYGAMIHQASFMWNA